MVTLHEVITFLVSMQISISSLQTHNVNRCGRSRHLARKRSLSRKRSSPNVFEDRKSGSAGMPRPTSYAVFCLKKKKASADGAGAGPACTQATTTSAATAASVPLGVSRLIRITRPSSGSPCSFFFNDTATTEIYTLSLHDALPIEPPRHVEEVAALREHAAPRGSRR